VYVEKKIKKNETGPAPTLELVANPDIAAELGAAKRAGQVLVTFAAETAETGEAVENGLTKMRHKRADLMVVNPVGADRTFGSERNEAVILTTDGNRLAVSERSKADLADAIWDEVAAVLLRTGA
jgi:phosphopantothenoylcysteine decarboxylase/phosphopantothenate--cysteine ligase